MERSTPKKKTDRSETKRSIIPRLPSSWIGEGFVQVCLILSICLTCPNRIQSWPMSTFDNFCQLCQILVNFGYDRDLLTPGLGSGSPGDRSGGDLWFRPGDNRLDPLSSRARLCQLSLPSGRVYVADLWELGREGATPLQDLGQLSERSHIKKVGHNLKFDLSFIQASQGRRLKMSNLFATMLASQVCWAGYYDLKKAPKATKNLFKKKTPEQSLKALAERHFGISLSKRSPGL
jgi:hypothetical protein